MNGWLTRLRGPNLGKGEAHHQGVVSSRPDVPQRPNFDFQVLLVIQQFLTFTYAVCNCATLQLSFGQSNLVMLYFFGVVADQMCYFDWSWHCMKGEASSMMWDLMVVC